MLSPTTPSKMATLALHNRNDEKLKQKSDLTVAFLFELQDSFEADMAQRTGLEPATPGVTGRYSNRLNYRCASAGLSSVSRKSWWLMTGSNRRPPACDAGALPAELISRSPCEARNLRRAHYQVNSKMDFFRHNASMEGIWPPPGTFSAENSRLHRFVHSYQHVFPNRDESSCWLARTG